jgi:hypothetical protein
LGEIVQHLAPRGDEGLAESAAGAVTHQCIQVHERRCGIARDPELALLRIVRNPHRPRRKRRGPADLIALLD